MQFQDLLKELGVEFLETGHHHCRDGWVQLKCCPYCRSENYHLGFNLQGRIFVCWRCRSHRTLETLFKLGADRKTAKAFYQSDDDGLYAQPERVRGGLKEPSGRGALSLAHRNYLLSRGFDPDSLQRRWKVEGIGIAGRLSWRIYIPILYRTQRVSWTTRAIGELVEQRYLSASASEEAVNHKSLLYGADYCLNVCVAVEGPFDAWAIGPGAVALFGTAFSTAQIHKLVRFPYRFVCFDNSIEAQAKARDLCEQLSVFPGTTENLQLDAKDPGSASQKELRLLRRAVRISTSA